MLLVQDEQKGCLNLPKIKLEFVRIDNLALPQKKEARKWT